MNRIMRIGDTRPSWFLAFFALLILGILFLPSCKKEYFETDRIKDATWNPELAVPLIKSTITVDEVLGRFDDQDIIVVDTTGVLALRYFGNVFSIAADSLIIIQNQSDQQSHTLTAAEAAALTTTSTPVTVPMSFDVAMDLSNLPVIPEIHSIEFKAGALRMDLTSQIPNAASGTIDIPSLTDPSGVPFHGTFSGVAFGSPQSIGVGNLAGYTLDLTNPNGPAPHYNTIHVDAVITINNGPGALPGQQFQVNSVMINLGFSTILGDMKQQRLAANEGEVRIRFFENDSAGTIHWDDPRVKGIFTNGIGATVQADSVELVFSGLSGSTPLTNGANPNPLINQPTLNSSSTVGVLTVSEFDVNHTNSNIVAIADQKPTNLDYSFVARLNPGAGPHLNWLLDTSKVRLDIEVFLPFDGTAKDFRRTDVVDVDLFPLDGDIQEIESVTLRLTIDNGFPADAHGQVIFGDSTLDVDSVSKQIVGHRIDSLFPDGRAVVFASPPVPTTPPFHVDQNNKKRTVLDITLDRAMLEKLEAQGFRRIVAQGWIDTYQLGTQRVRIYQDYTMDLYLGMMVKAKYNLRP